MMFKHMPLDEAKDFYEKLQKEKTRLENEGKDVWIITQALDDIYFFTNGLRHDY